MEQQEISTLVKLLRDPGTLSLALDIIEQNEDLYWDPDVKWTLARILQLWNNNMFLLGDRIRIQKIITKLITMGVITISDLYGTQRTGG